METVTSFNNELSGLYDQKPPISKAQMASITRSAMRAIKFYKHVVQSVEKFIQKCKSEYKIPGLYVIDSIVRQSRHQFGPDKDVFASRFSRNIQTTFVHLFRCPPEDKSKIIRVLNLWQKNNVFVPQVIQPLFDLADPNNPVHQTVSVTQLGDSNNVSNGLNSSMPQESPAAHTNDEQNHQSINLSDLTNTMSGNAANKLDSDTIRQLQQLQQLLIRQTGGETSNSGMNLPTGQDSVKFNKNLLDFDYDDEDEEDKTDSPHVPNILEGNNLAQLLQDPNVLRHLQTLQKLKQHEMEEKQTKLTEMMIQEEAFEKHLQTVLKKLPFANECDLSRHPTQDINAQNNTGMGLYGLNASTLSNLSSIQSLLQQQQQQQQQQSSGMLNIDPNEPEVEFIADEGKVEVINLDANDSRSPTPERDRYKQQRNRRSRSRSRDRLRDRRRRSSRSRSRTRSPRTSRRRSSRDRDRDRIKEKEREKEREYERERRRKGLPDIKKEHLSVCSTTLWVGHLSKLVQQEELSDTFGKYGDIVSIDMIHPRGCAFIVMNRRQDAYKAMNSLKNHKMQSRAITISWAAGKGVKSKEWKDYWDLDLGVSYIPCEKLSLNTDLESLEEGGMFDEDSMPQWIKDKSNSIYKKKDDKDNSHSIIQTSSTSTTPAGNVINVGHGLDTSQPPPTSGILQMVPPFQLGPRLMPPPMGMHIPMGVPPPPMMIPALAGLQNMSGPPPPQMDKSIPPPNTGNTTTNSLAEHFLGSVHMAMAAAVQQQVGNTGGGFPPVPPMPMPPQMPPLTSSIVGDDHMDIEMEDDLSMHSLTKNNNNNSNNNNNNNHNDKQQVQDIFGMSSLFNRPPPQLSQLFNNDNQMNNNQQQDQDQRVSGGSGSGGGSRDRELSRDRNSRERDRNDFRNDRRGRDRDRGDRERERGGDRGDRRDYRGNDRERGGGGGGRWNNDGGSNSSSRGRSRERNDRDRNDRNHDRNSIDRFDKDKGIQDRLRELANDVNNQNNINNPNNNNNNNNLRNNEYQIEIPRRDQPPSLLDLPLKDQSSLMWNTITQGNNFSRGNYMDNRRNMEDNIPSHLIHPDEHRMRHDDRDMFDNMRRDDYNRMDDFDRRGQRDFFPPNRFGPRGMPLMGMGMNRGGQPFGGGGGNHPRGGNGPMFMRSGGGSGGGRQGSGGGGYHPYNNDRPSYFERENFNYSEREERSMSRGSNNSRGNNERQRNSSSNRQSWRGDDDDNNKKDKNNLLRGDNRRSSSRWGNSPKQQQDEQDDDTEREIGKECEKSSEQENDNDSIKKSNDENNFNDDNEKKNQQLEPECEALSPSNEYEDNGPPGYEADFQNDMKQQQNNIVNQDYSPEKNNDNFNDTNANDDDRNDCNTTPLYDEPSTTTSETNKEENIQEVCREITTTNTTIGDADQNILGDD